MNLDELKEEWRKDSYINPTDIILESIRTSSYHAKYISELSIHKQRLIKLSNDYATLKTTKIRYFSGLMGKEELLELGISQYQGKKLLKADMETQLSGDSQIQLITQKIQYTDIIVSFLESVIKNLNNRNYEISNYISMTKFQAGF